MQKIIENIISATWKPFLILCIEIGLVSTIIWVITSFTPHNISFLKDLGLMSWIVAVVTVRLLLYRSKAVEDAIDEPSTNNSQRFDSVNEMMLPILEREAFDKMTPPEPPPGPKNVRAAIYPAVKAEGVEGDGSTRE